MRGEVKGWNQKAQRALTAPAPGNTTGWSSSGFVKRSKQALQNVCGGRFISRALPAVKPAARVASRSAAHNAPCSQDPSVASSWSNAPCSSRAAVKENASFTRSFIQTRLTRKGTASGAVVATAETYLASPVVTRSLLDDAVAACKTAACKTEVSPPRNANQSITWTPPEKGKGSSSKPPPERGHGQAAPDIVVDLRPRHQKQLNSADAGSSTVFAIPSTPPSPPPSPPTGSTALVLPLAVPLPPQGCEPAETPLTRNAEAQQTAEIMRINQNAEAKLRAEIIRINQNTEAQRRAQIMRINQNAEAQRRAEIMRTMRTAGNTRNSGGDAASRRDSRNSSSSNFSTHNNKQKMMTRRDKLSRLEDLKRSKGRATGTAGDEGADMENVREDSRFSFKLKRILRQTLAYRMFSAIAEVSACT